jgi:hypothetical protein
VDNGNSDKSPARRAMDLTQTIRDFIAYIDGLQYNDLTPSDCAMLCSLLDELMAINLKALRSMSPGSAARHSSRTRRAR